MRTWWLLLALAVECIACHVVADHYEQRTDHISQVDVIEKNTVHDGEGRVTLTQFVLWDLERKDKREHVVAWRMVRRGEQVQRKNGMYRVTWGSRIVQAVSYRDRHSQDDPEIIDREYRNCELRRGHNWDK